MRVKTELGLDVYFPGCNKYYQQDRPNYLPYLDGALFWPWQPRNLLNKSLLRQRREFPSCFNEACAYGSLAHVITFWAQGQDVKNCTYSYEGSDATPLMWAALRGHLSIARFLIDQGVDVNAINSLGHNALLWAVSAIHYDMTRFLLDNGANPTLRDKQGYDAYFTAVQNNNLPLLLMICEYHPIDIYNRDEEGHSLLHWAAYANSLSICQYLVEKCHIELDARDYCGRTPLVWAAREGYAVVVEYLVLSGARLDVTDVDGYTAIQYTQYRKHREAAYVLEKCSVSFQNGITESVDFDYSQSPLLRHGYVPIRQRRRRGTMAMMFEEPLFFVMSILGVLHVIISYLALMIVPPLFSYVFFGCFFFKNSLWVLIFGIPLQGSKPEPTDMEKIGIASNFGDSARGCWIFRNRDAASLFGLLSFLFMQQYAWMKMGLTQIFTYFPNENAALDSNGREYVYQPYQSNLLKNFFYNKAALEQSIILLLFFLIILSAFMCKIFSMQSTYELTTSGLNISPVWNIMKHRVYGWLHPRLLCIDRHMLIPLRVFYCYERDVFFKRFDGYSIALDCPIAESNHVWFFIFVTSFACLQFLIFCWSWEQTSELLNCPSYSSTMEWIIRSIFNVFIHGLPCRNTTRAIVSQWNPWLSWLQYIIPGQANYLGVWLLHFSFTAFLMSTVVVVRQWIGAATGVTRMELSNPTAPSSEGGLVNIFPITPSTSTPWSPPEGVTEGVTSVVDNNNALKLIKQKSKPQCIYADSKNIFLNILFFLFGRSGRQWRGAMAVSPSNTPVFTLPFITD